MKTMYNFQSLTYLALLDEKMYGHGINSICILRVLVNIGPVHCTV